MNEGVQEYRLRSQEQGPLTPAWSPGLQSLTQREKPTMSHNYPVCIHSSGQDLIHMIHFCFLPFSVLFVFFFK